MLFRQSPGNQKMTITSIAKKILPAVAYESIVRKKKERERSRLARLPKVSETRFTQILTDDLRLQDGDVVFVHSSLDQLNLDFPFYTILTLLRDVIGPQGTMLFPTYPNHRISSYEYLLQGKVFDVRRTPSYAGLLTEFARKQPAAVRSLHPTKSVCAIGPLAGELTKTHQNSRYPYDSGSPFSKLTEHKGKIVGLGVWTSRLSFVYCVDDALKNDFPVPVYHERVFAVPCIDDEGRTQIVETYAHNMKVIDVHEGPNFFRTHVAPDICADLMIEGMKFFRADARRLFDDLMELAERGVTVYPRSVYRK